MNDHNQEVLLKALQGYQVFVSEGEDIVKVLLSEADPQAAKDLLIPNPDSVYTFEASPEHHEVNGFSVPKGLNALVPGMQEVWVETINAYSYAVIYQPKEQFNNEFLRKMLKKGTLHLTQKDAVASCKARLMIDPSV